MKGYLRDIPSLRGFVVAVMCCEIPTLFCPVIIISDAERNTFRNSVRLALRAECEAGCLLMHSRFSAGLDAIEMLLANPV